MRAADAARAEARATGAALSFLTRLPIGARLGVGAEDLGRAVPVFPLVGAALGTAVGAAASVLSGPCPALVAASIALALGVIATGAIHLDGLADTADALGAGSREERLRILRDPRIGSYGATAVALLLLVESASLAELAMHANIPAVAAAFALSRAVAPGLGCVLRYARQGGGLGRSLTDGGGRARGVASALIACGIACALTPHRAPSLIATAALCWLGMLILCRRRFGGVTGDTLGAAIAVTEAACLAVAAS
jgi:adenosylcobinamide-GDP ribazoletransferase